MVPGTSNAGVSLACGFVVQMAAQVVAGLPFPVLMLVGKACSPFIALACLGLLFPRERNQVFKSVGSFPGASLLLHAVDWVLCSGIC